MTVSSTSSQSAAAQPRLTPSVPSLAARLRLAGLVVVAVYPFITVLLMIVFPLTDGWPLWARTLVVAPIMVAAMMFGIMPFLQKRFGRFVATGRFA